MLIPNESSANEPFIQNNTPNPQFFGSVASHSGGTPQTFTVIPAPIVKAVTVTPSPVVENGVVIEFPPYTETVTIQAPPKQVTIAGDSTTSIKNAFESVGVINPNGQIRLCALVRKNIIAGARHYDRPPYQSYVGMEVRFVGANGTQTATIISVIFTRDDFECYRLDRDITVVSPAAIAPLESQGSYTGRTVVCFGLVSLSRPAAAKTILKYALPSSNGWVALGNNKIGQPVIVQPGDSGAPSFLYENGVARYFGSMASMNLSQFNINMASPWADAIASL